MRAWPLVRIGSRWIMLEGLSGSGKSTLALALTETFEAAGLPVDLILEDDIFAREEFHKAGESFRTRRTAAAKDLLVAYSRLASRHEGSRARLVFDWNASDMAEDLDWASDLSGLAEHVAAVHRVAAVFHPVILFFEVEAEVGLNRAVTQRGQGWLDRHAALGGGTPEMSPRERALRYYARQDQRFQRNHRAYAADGWPVRSIDGNGDKASVLSNALEVLTASL